MRDPLPLPVFFLATVLPLTASAAIYKYTDANGRIAYSDKPVNGAEIIKVQRAPSAPERGDDDADAVSEENFSEDGEVAKYNELKVLHPTPEKVYNERSGSVQVIFLPSPRLSKSHQLIINVNGKDISRGSHGNLNLTNVARGSHTVVGRIVDADGYLMIESPPVTFHVRKSGF